MRRGLVAGFVLVLLTAGWPAGAAASDLMGGIDESWDSGPPESRFENMAEERFQMECHYLGIDGERRDQARKLYDALLKSRDRVIDSRDRGDLTRIEAIAKLNLLDVEYYHDLRTRVKGKRNQERLEKMIAKAGARNESGGGALSRH